MKYRLRFCWPTNTYLQIAFVGMEKTGDCYVCVFDENGELEVFGKTTLRMTLEEAREYLVNEGNKPLGSDIKRCLGLYDQNSNMIKFEQPIEYENVRA